MAVAGASLIIGGEAARSARAASPAATVKKAAAVSDAQLREPIGYVVVLYAESRNFNNLFAGFAGLQHPLDQLKPERSQQRDRNGELLGTPQPIWHGLEPQQQHINHRTYRIEEDDTGFIARFITRRFGL